MISGLTIIFYPPMISFNKTLFFNRTIQARRRIWVLILLAAISFVGQGALAQSDSAFTISPATFANWAALEPMGERLEQSHQILFGESVEESLGSAGSETTSGTSSAADRAIDTTVLVPTTFTSSPNASGRQVAWTMAQSYPETSRAQAEELFEQLLSGFKQIESQFGLPGNDVATAAAAFLVGNYSVYRNTPVPDEHFVPLVEQMRQIIGTTPAFAQTSAVAKQETYEQLAILGMFMATIQIALNQQPDAELDANAQQAAADYLRTFLGTDPDRIRLSANGLEIQ